MTRPILIVEDDPDISESLKYNFEREGLPVITALTGEAGLAAALTERESPSLIILDLMLPGMSGTQFCRRLRRAPATRRPPLSLISPCTATIRGLASGVVPVPGADPGPRRSAVNLDSVESVSLAVLVDRVGRLSDARMRQICGALAVAVGCSE